jgi:hypothetical protein
VLQILRKYGNMGLTLVELLLQVNLFYPNHQNNEQGYSISN